MKYFVPQNNNETLMKVVIVEKDLDVSLQNLSTNEMQRENYRILSNIYV